MPFTMPRVTPRLLDEASLLSAGGAGSTVSTGDGLLMGGLTELGSLAGDDFLLLEAGGWTGSPRGDGSRTDVAIDAPERAWEARDD